MVHIPRFNDTHISLAHGNGGRLMRELIEEVFVPALGNPHLDTGADAVALPTPADRDLVVTTDGFTVQPLEFPAGTSGRWPFTAPSTIWRSAVPCRTS